MPPVRPCDWAKRNDNLQHQQTSFKPMHHKDNQVPTNNDPVGFRLSWLVTICYCQQFCKTFFQGMTLTKYLNIANTSEGCLHTLHHQMSTKTKISRTSEMLNLPCPWTRLHWAARQMQYTRPPQQSRFQSIHQPAITNSSALQLCMKWCRFEDSCTKMTKMCQLHQNSDAAWQTCHAHTLFALWWVTPAARRKKVIARDKNRTISPTFNPIVHLYFTRTSEHKQQGNWSICRYRAA